MLVELTPWRGSIPSLCNIIFWMCFALACGMDPKTHINDTSTHHLVEFLLPNLAQNKISSFWKYTNIFNQSLFLLTLCIWGLLWTGYFRAWIETITRQRVNAYGWTDCKLAYFCLYFFRHYSSALLVMMSVEKCIALYFPFKTRNICTVRTAKWTSGIAFVIVFSWTFSGSL